MDECMHYPGSKMFLFCVQYFRIQEELQWAKKAKSSCQAVSWTLTCTATCTVSLSTN